MFLTDNNLRLIKLLCCSMSALSALMSIDSAILSNNLIAKLQFYKHLTQQWLLNNIKNEG